MIWARWLAGAAEDISMVCNRRGLCPAVDEYGLMMVKMIQGTFLKPFSMIKSLKCMEKSNFLIKKQNIAVNCTVSVITKWRERQIENLECHSAMYHFSMRRCHVTFGKQMKLEVSSRSVLQIGNDATGT